MRNFELYYQLYFVNVAIKNPRVYEFFFFVEPGSRSEKSVWVAVMVTL